MDYKHTCDTIYSFLDFVIFQNKTDNIYDFWRLLLLHFFTRPPIFLPIQNMFLPVQVMDGKVSA